MLQRLDIIPEKNIQNLPAAYHRVLGKPLSFCHNQSGKNDVN